MLSLDFLRKTAPDQSLVSIVDLFRQGNRICKAAHFRLKSKRISTKAGLPTRLRGTARCYFCYCDYIENVTAAHGSLQLSDGSEVG